MRIAILLLVLLSSVWATDRLDPNNCPSGVECSDVMKDYNNGAISEKEAKDVVASLLYENPGYPDYAFVRDWNTAVQYGYNTYEEVPEGIDFYVDADSAESHVVIREPWLAIMSVTPSMYDNDEDKVLVPPGGEVQSEYDYKIKIPNSTTNSEECARWWEQSGDPEETLTVKVFSPSGGNTIIAEGKASEPEQRMAEYTRSHLDSLGMFGMGSSNEVYFDATLDIHVPVNRYDIYREPYCSPTPDGGLHCEYRCTGGPRVEEENHRAQLHTTYPEIGVARLHEFAYYVSYVFDTDSRIVLNLFSLAPMNFFNVQFKDAYYNKGNYNYGLKHSSAPYDALQFTGYPRETESGHKMSVRTEGKVVDITTAAKFIYEHGAGDEGQNMIATAQKYGYPIYHTTADIVIEKSEISGEKKCSIVTGSHFAKIVLDDVCDREPLPQSEITITTGDKDEYKKGETIPIKITMASDSEPFSGTAHLTFQGETQEISIENGAWSGEFPAEEGGVVTVEFETDLKHSSATGLKKISVTKEEAWGFMLQLVLLVGFWYMMYIVLKKVVRKYR